MHIQIQVRRLESLAADLSKAASIREKVRLANSIFETLGECESLLERFIADEVGFPNGKKSQGGDVAYDTPYKHDDHINDSLSTQLTGEKKFQGMSLAEVGRVVLTERGVLHGSEIERIAKTGGFSGQAVKFQSYLAVAFKRDGGFENLGKNRWKLKAKQNAPNHDNP